MSTPSQRSGSRDPADLAAAAAGALRELHAADPDRLVDVVVDVLDSVSMPDPAPALRMAGAVATMLTDAEPYWCSPADLGSQLVRLQQQIDVLTGVSSEWTTCFEEQGGPNDAGAPTIGSWMRQHLRVTGYEASRRVKAGRVLRQLPATRKALVDGAIGASHVNAIARGIDELGVDVVAAFESTLLDVATACDADAVAQAMTRLRDTLDPDAADEAYVRALERRDLKVAEVGDGFAVNGFVDPETGVMFRQVLYAGAQPTSPDDERSAGQRRVGALNELCRSVLDHGLPTDRGLRPHLFVTITADRLAELTADPTTLDWAKGRGTTASAAGDPPVLHGYGTIGPRLAARLACDCAITPVIVDRPGAYPHVLDVGRSSRLATLKQRQAVFVQQGGRCFNPGCDNTRLEIHHMRGWLQGGRTDMANLRGYCTRCHHLIHLGLLIIRPAGHGEWLHANRYGGVLRDRRREIERATIDEIDGLVDSSKRRHRAEPEGNHPAEPDDKADIKPDDGDLDGQAVARDDRSRGDRSRGRPPDRSAEDARRLIADLRAFRRRRRRRRASWRDLYRNPDGPDPP